MAASNADTGYGVTLGIYNGSTYDTIAEVTSVSGPGWSRDAIDVTHLSSDNNYREYIAGIMDAGEVSITANYIESATHALIAAVEAGLGDANEYQLTEAGGVTITFAGICTSFDIGERTVDGEISCDATFKVSGKPTLA